MSEIDKILRMLADHFGDNDAAQNVISDLTKKRQKFEKGGTAFQDWKNIIPVNPGEDIFVDGPNAFLNELFAQDVFNELARNNPPNERPSNVYDYDPAEDIIVDGTTTPPPTSSSPPPPTTSFSVSVDPAEDIVVNAPTSSSPPPPTTSFSVSVDPAEDIVVDAPTSSSPPPPTTSFSVSVDPAEDIVVNAPTSSSPPPPTTSFSVSVDPAEDIVVTARTTTPPPTPPPTTTINLTTLPPASTESPTTRPPTTRPPTTTPPPTIVLTTLPPASTEPPTRPPVTETVSIASTPALTWNPNLTSVPGTVMFPAEYKPLQQINLPNYANVYDMLFQGQGANSPLGQSMLTPADQPSRLDAAMAAAQQAQQQQPAPQQNTGAGKARGGSVNSAIDGIIAYLQSIRR